MVQEVIWAVEEIVKHLLVLEHLIRDVGPGNDDIEKTMSELAHLFVVLAPDTECLKVPFCNSQFSMLVRMALTKT